MEKGNVEERNMEERGSVSMEREKPQSMGFPGSCECGVDEERKTEISVERACMSADNREKKVMEGNVRVLGREKKRREYVGEKRNR